MTNKKSKTIASFVIFMTIFIFVVVSCFLMYLSRKDNNKEQSTTTTSSVITTTTTTTTTKKPRFKNMSEYDYEKCLENYLKQDYPDMLGFVEWDSETSSSGKIEVRAHDILSSDFIVFFKVYDNKKSLYIDYIKVGSTTSKIKETIKC